MKNKWGIITVLIVCASVMLGFGKYNLNENENDQWNNELKDENNWKREEIKEKNAYIFKSPAINQQRREIKKTATFSEDPDSDNYSVDTFFSNAKVTRIQKNPQPWVLHYTLTGYSNGIYSVAFSPDGTTMASGSRDNTIKLWNVSTGTEIRTLTGHSYVVYSIAFSPDGTTLASGSYDHTVKLWEVSTGTELRTLTGHSNYVHSVAFSPDGSTLASGSWDNTIKLWNVSTGTELRTLTGHKGNVCSVAFSPDGTTLASGSGALQMPENWDNTIKFWNVSTGTEIRTLTGHSNYVQSVAFSPDGSTLASGSYDDTVKLWEVSTGTEIRTLTGHSECVQSVAFSPDSMTLASGSYDHTVKLWDVNTGTETMTLTGHSNDISSVAFSPDGKMLVSGSTDDTIKLWAVDSDLDGMPDFWECQMGLNATLNDSADDKDEDGMTNLWEYQNQFNANDRTDAVEDADGDWISNLAEYQANTDPRDVLSVPLLSLSILHFIIITVILFISFFLGFLGISFVSSRRDRNALILQFEAPDYETAVQIQRGKFLNYQQYQEAQRVGVVNSDQLRLVDRYQVTDYSTAIERQREDFAKLIISLCRQDRELTFSVIARQLQVPEDRILPIFRELIRLQLVEGVLEENKRLFVSDLPTEDEIRRVKDFISNIREGIPVIMTQIATKTNLDGKRCERIITELTSGSNPAGEFLELEGVFIKSETTMQAIDQLLRQYSEIENDKLSKQYSDRRKK